MATLTPAQVYQDLTGVGFTPAQATTMVGIAGAESGYRDDAVGDVSLEDNTWGPSYGLFQIRTLKQATGSGGDRDVANLTGDDAAQAKAAYDISQQGRDFTPWTTFTDGAYQKFLPAGSVAAGAQQLAATSSSTSSLSLGQTLQKFALIGGGLLLALVLVGAGAVSFAHPIQRGKAAAKTTAKVAAVMG